MSYQTIKLRINQVACMSTGGTLPTAANMAARKAVKKACRFLALREMRRYKKSTELLICKLFFQRLFREAYLCAKYDLRFQMSALLAQEEAWKACLFKIHKRANRVIIMPIFLIMTPKHIQLALRNCG